ncbi:N-acetyltransferase family protein [Limnohabitans sp.]|uniref:GNAT family N-acetyltransferase n=1 Tax=Limnohabitans sp. TaxID=1907725 RepID=UPI0039BC2938|nr:GNAT family N-acetyltransferase [Comamonadaceae bacterium]
MSLIRHAVPEDARAVAEIHVDAWRAAYSAILPEAFLASLTVASCQAFWAQVLADKQGDLLVAMASDRMLGWISTGPCRGQDAAMDDAEIWALYASPSVWSTGVGCQLWSTARTRLLEQGHRQCRLWVLAQNARAIRFYKAAGFERDEFPAKTFELGGTVVQEIRWSCRLEA